MIDTPASVATSASRGGASGCSHRRMVAGATGVLRNGLRKPLAGPRVSLVLRQPLQPSWRRSPRSSHPGRDADSPGETHATHPPTGRHGRRPRLGDRARPERLQHHQDLRARARPRGAARPRARSRSAWSPRPRPTPTSSSCATRPRPRRRRTAPALIALAGKFDGDNDGQVTAIENLVQQGVKAILITPEQLRRRARAIKKAQDAGSWSSPWTPRPTRQRGRATYATEQRAGRQAAGPVRQGHAGRPRRR